MIIQLIEELKNLLSPFHTGDRVLCKHENGNNREGIVIDPLIASNVESDECNKFINYPACVVRFETKISQNETIITNEIVRHGLIQKIPFNIEDCLGTLKDGNGNEVKVEPAIDFKPDYIRNPITADPTDYSR